MMLFILALVFSNIKSEKGTSCYYSETEDRSQIHYKKVDSDTCQKWCDKDAKCTQYFYKTSRRCFLSYCNNNKPCNDKWNSYRSRRRYCPWTRYTKGS